MDSGIRLRITDRDPDYYGVELRAWNGRFAATTFLFAGLRQLSELAAVIDSYRSGTGIVASYVIGTRDPGFAGGCCELRLDADAVGHVTLDVDIDDDDQRFTAGHARLSLGTEFAPLDRFAQALRDLEGGRCGEAYLEASV